MQIVRIKGNSDSKNKENSKKPVENKKGKLFRYCRCDNA